MTEKELKRMSRIELIEIIAAQKKQEQELKKQLEQAQKMLEERSVKIANAGSIAEAALSLNGVFEAAQAAADTYLQSIYSANAELGDLRLHAQREYERILAAADQEAKARIMEAEKRCAMMLADAEKHIQSKAKAAPKESSIKAEWDDFFNEILKK